MNHLLYNFSIIMILLGIIMLTSYITKAYNKNNNNCNLKQDEEQYDIKKVYDQRPSNIYNVMFNEPSIWNGYETIQ